MNARLNMMEWKQSVPVLLVALMLMGAGCTQKKEEPAESSTQPSEEQVEINWDWAKYERKDRLVIGRMQCGIMPKQTLQIKSEGNGLITLNVDKEISIVQKDFEWARMNEEELAEKETRKEIVERQRHIDKIRKDELELPEERKKAREALNEAKRKLRLMEAVMKSDALKELSGELFNGDVTEVNEKTLQEAKSAYDLAVKKLAFMEQFEEQLNKDQAVINRLDKENSERTLEEARDRSLYIAPFDGELQLIFDFIKGEKEYTVAAREVLATLSDYSEIHAYLPVKSAPWLNLKPQSLSLQLQDRDRTEMPFLDDKVVIDERTNQSDKMYVFGVPLEGHETLKRMAGGKMSADLITKLPEEAYIVPKYDLSLYALGKTKTLEWEQMVQDLWPGAKLIAEGLSHVAIQYRP